MVSVAIVLKKSIDKGLMIDSKKISENKRLCLCRYILSHARSIGVGICDNHVIDKINIHNATLESMKKAITNLDLNPKIAYIDGKFTPNLDIECKSLVRGDAIMPEISAASIIAKVLRDNYMISLDKILPVYGFKSNKGYGTSNHMKALNLFGPSIYHRFTFLIC